VRRLRARCKFIANENYSKRRSLWRNDRAVEFSLSISIRLATTVVSAAATDFHHMRLLGVLTIFAAILTTLLGRTIAGWMRAYVFLIFCHKQPLLSGEFSPILILRLKHHAVK